jgi:hypothetical protein
MEDWYKQFAEYLVKMDDDKLSYVIEQSWEERCRRSFGRIDAILDEINDDE